MDRRSFHEDGKCEDGEPPDLGVLPNVHGKIDSRNLDKKKADDPIRDIGFKDPATYVSRGRITSH